MDCQQNSDSSKKIKKKHKKEKKHKHKKAKKSKKASKYASSDESISDEWVEKELKDLSAKAGSESSNLARDDWMTGGLLLKTYTKNDLKKNEVVKEKPKSDYEAYDPSKSSRELNVHWKNGGQGLPSFRKPAEDSDDDDNRQHASGGSKSMGNWKKKDANKQRSPERTIKRSRSPTPEPDGKVDEPQNVAQFETNIETSDFLTDQQMNELGAKLIKAEILGNNDLVASLKDKLEKARSCRNTNRVNKKQANDEHVLLTKSHAGQTKPLERTVDDKYGSNSKKKNKRVETHVGGERVRYFADDDTSGRDIRTMYEKEKFTSASESDAQFANIIAKHTNPNDELEDIFSDKIRKNISEADLAAKEKSQAIRDHLKYTAILENCDKCFESGKMNKQLIVKMGKSAYLTLPWYEGITTGHCLIIPQQHCISSTTLDEDVWREITEFRSRLTLMYAAQKRDVIFFESARYLHKQRHMKISCVAGNFEEAPFYFKKAIQESETEWAMNKKLIELKDRDVRRAIPKNLPYFWVHFGMERGFAHVIEDEESFPSNFAEEIIGGLLHLDANKWRKPRKEYKPDVKVKQLSDWWRPFDTIQP